MSKREKSDFGSVITTDGVVVAESSFRKRLAGHRQQHLLVQLESYAGRLLS